MILLRFQNEAHMLDVLGDVPHSPFGHVRVRGLLGTPAITEPTGEIDPETGEMMVREIQPADVWPGYHAEIEIDELPIELKGFVVQR